MKNTFKKISAVVGSVLMVGMTMGVAAAANYPAPFVVGGSADAAIVYGTGVGVNPSDLVQAGYIQTNLAASTSSSGGTPSGDNVLLSKSTDNLNLQDTWSVFTGTIDDEELSTLLAEGTYIADDNDEFDYEQKITLGTPQLTHFRDSDYEDLAGLASKTPVVGFKVGSNTFILNYTLEFLEDVSSDIVSARMDDIEGSDFPLMGKSFYVSEFHNGSTADGNKYDKAILLDSAEIGNVKEGEIVTVAGKQISIDWIDADEVVFMVDGARAPASGKLMKGNSYKLDDGTYLGVRDVTKLAVSGEIGGASFSLGSGKLEINHGSDIKLNDDTITGLKGYLVKSSNNLDRIVIEWKTDEESFISPVSELMMPGFGAVKVTMNELVRSEEEKITIEKDSDTSVQVTAPLKKGSVSFNILYTNASGEFIGIGKATDEKLATTNYSDFAYYERRGGEDWHSYFIATYNVSKEGESYLLRALVSEDQSAARNETEIQYYDGSSWTTACKDKTTGDDCKIGDVSLNIGAINYSSGGDRSVNISAGTNVNFHTAITPGGLTIYLPFDNNASRWAGLGTQIANETNFAGMPGAVNFNGSDKLPVGKNWDVFHLFMDGEDKDETLGAGTGFSIAIDDTSDDNVQISQMNTTGGGNVTTGSGGLNGLELQDTSTYETYVKDDVAPRLLHYTKPDEDWAEVYYPTGDSETSAMVYITEESSTIVGGSGSLGEILVKDTEVSSMSTKNLIVVGGSCINSAAATLLGGAKCTEDFTTATGIGSGQFLIQSFGDAYTTGKVALLVAGYETADTMNAVTYLRTATVDTTAGKKYKGTSGTSAELVVE